jgi:hypothetical protein
MRIRKIRIVLPPHMQASAAADARMLSTIVATTLMDHSAGAAPNTITMQGLGRPAHHLRHAMAAATRSAVGKKPEGA